MLLDRLLDPIVTLSGAEAGAVRLLSDSGERLQLASAIGLPLVVQQAEALVDRHCGLCGRTLDEQHAVMTSDLRDCTARHGPGFFGASCRRVLSVPLRHRTRVLGLYNLYFADGVEPPPNVMPLLRSLGDLLGLALDNARLEAESLRATVLHERQQMAAEIHDSVAQTLTFVKMRLPLLQDALTDHDPAHAARYLADVRQAVGEAHESLREIVTEFRTRIGPRGLANALEALVARFRERNAIELSVVQRGLPLSLSADTETEVFHVVQEALANVERHSQARHAWLSIEGGPIGFEVRVEDDGVGPRPGDEQCDDGSHFGIGIMGDRAQRMGGELVVQARPGGGTVVRLSCHVHGGTAAQEAR